MPGPAAESPGFTWTGAGTYSGEVEVRLCPRPRNGFFSLLQSSVCSLQSQGIQTKWVKRAHVWRKPVGLTLKDGFVWVPTSE